jgi:hypothetical protein
VGGVTYRSIVIGVILIPLVNMWVVLTEVMWFSGSPSTISIYSHAVFPLALLVALNFVIRRIRREWELKPPELLIIYTMLSLASSLCGHDMGQIAVQMVAHLDYHGQIEQRYAEFRDYVPGWLLVKDHDALSAFYVGQESIYSPQNYLPWLKPLGWWLLLIFAMCAVMLGLNLLFRKQWTENEKLAYPIIQLPMILTTETDMLVKSRLFWLGSGIAVFISLMNGLHVLFPVFPGIPIIQIVNIQSFFSERPWTDMGALWVSFYPFAIGLCFFMPLDLAFSCWFFFFFWKFQRVWAAHIGAHGMPGFPFIEEQTAGGYYAIALIAIWITRHHFVRVGRLLLGYPVDNATPWERHESRLAASLMVVGSVIIFLFWHAAGMDAWVIVAVFVMYFLVSISVTRMRAELGPPSHDLHNIQPSKQIMRFYGASNMVADYPRSVALFGFVQFFTRAYRSHPMPHSLEGLRIAERLKTGYGRAVAAQAVAIFCGGVFGFFALLWMHAKYGGSAQILGPGDLFGRETWDIVNVWFTAPEKHTWGATNAIVIGLFSALGLSVLRMNLAWFPFHPVGYAVSGSWSMDQLWMCVFTAWLIKLILLKYGGAKAFRPAVPFFIGLMLGDFVMGSFWQIFGILMETEVYVYWPYQYPLN